MIKGGDRAAGTKSYQPCATTGSFGVGNGAASPGPEIFNKGTLRQVYDSLMAMADKQKVALAGRPSSRRPFPFSSCCITIFHERRSRFAAGLSQPRENDPGRPV